MGRTLNPKDRAKIIHKKLKACSYNTTVFMKRFCPDKNDFKDYESFINDINLYNKFFGYIMIIEL